MASPSGAPSSSSSWSAKLDHLRSPLENVFQILPQGHDKALKQAFYNTGASLFVVFAGAAAVAAYYILEAFLRPLLWAVLCGTVLHPFKSRLTKVVQCYLYGLRTGGTPLLMGAVLLPLQGVDLLAEALSAFLVRHSRLMMTIGAGLPAVYAIYYFGPLQAICSGLSTTFVFIYEAIGYFSAFWVWSVVVAYLLIVILYWTPQSSTILKSLSVPVWIALILHLSTIAGVLRVPLVMALITMMVVGLLSEVTDSSAESLQASAETTSQSRFSNWLSWWRGREDTTSVKDHGDVTIATDQQAETITSGTAVSPDKLPVPPHTLPPRTASKGSTPPSADQQQTPPSGGSLSDHCFAALFWAIVLVRLWMSFWLVRLVPLLFAFLLLKKLGVQLGSWSLLREKVQGIGVHFKDRVSHDSRIEVLIPKPVRAIGSLLLRGDANIVSALEKSMDKTVSILIILMLVIGLLFGTVFSAVQVHRESTHLVSVTSNLLNNTLHPELSQWLPDQAVMHNAMDSMVGNAYLYGREWLAIKIQDLVNGDEEKKHHLEKQILEVWDRLYENWFARNISTVMKPNHFDMDNFDLSNLTRVWSLAKRGADFNLDFVAFIKENIGTLLSVVESVWLVLKGNINLLLSVLSAALSLLFGGGTALLNFIISVVIFITTLFYLLASSGDQYKPVEWFTQGGGNKFGRAVEEAISSVFLASFKMAAFYGLYTWLTHTVFNIQIVFIPSALAAAFAAIPFVGTYWAALPAVVELWLVNGESLQAVLLLVAHMLPTYVVDTAILSEIKGGHPYLTGLAIAGGIYWLGLEGSIIGPIVLCCLIVAVNVYSTMLRPEPGTEPATHTESSSADMKNVKFNVKRQQPAM